MARLGEWIDVSVPVRSGMVHWPGDPEVRLERTKSIAEGEEANLTRVSMSAHTGTHMDAPLHFFEDDPGIETFPLDIALGRARVVLLEGEEPGDYDLVCLPVKVVGGDGAPARVLLRAVQALPPRERV